MGERKGKGGGKEKQVVEMTDEWNARHVNGYGCNGYR